MEIKDYEISLNNLSKYDMIISKLVLSDPISINNFFSTYEILFSIKEDIMRSLAYTRLKYLVYNSKVNYKDYTNVLRINNNYEELVNHINHLLLKKYKYKEVINKCNKDMINYFDYLFKLKRAIHEDMLEIVQYNDNLKNKLLKHKYNDDELIDTVIQYTKYQEFMAKKCHFKRYKDLVLYKDDINEEFFNLLISIKAKNNLIFNKVLMLDNKEFNYYVIDTDYSKNIIINTISNIYDNDYLNKLLYIFDNCISYVKFDEFIKAFKLMPKIFINYNNDINSLGKLSFYIGEGLYNYLRDTTIYDYDIDYNGKISGYINELFILNNLCNNENKIVVDNAYRGLLHLYCKFIDNLNIICYVDGIHENINNININYITKNKNYRNDLISIFNDYNEYKDIIAIAIATRIVNNNTSGKDILSLYNEKYFGVDVSDEKIIKSLIDDVIKVIIELYSKINKK